MCGVKIILILHQRPLQRFTRLLPKRFFLSAKIFERTKATYFIKLGGGGGGLFYSHASPDLKSCYVQLI